MGTFSDSKISTARKLHQCANGMDHAIAKGEPYLRYKLGQRNDICVCLPCATRKRMDPGSSFNRALYYDCAALRDFVQRNQPLSERGL